MSNQIIEEAKEAMKPDFLSLTDEELTIETEKDLIEMTPKKIIHFGLPFLDEKLIGIFPAELIVVGGSTGTGKCFDPNTEVVMADGNIKKIKNIKVGEKLMGADNQPRFVLGTTSGEDEMFEIQQNYGDNYIVNSAHILTLRHTVTGEIIDISLKKYFKQTKNFKHLWKGFKVARELPKQKLSVHPYVLGAWLGDGHQREGTITFSMGSKKKKVRKQIKKILSDFSIVQRNEKITFAVVDRKNINSRLIDEFRRLNLFNNRHIPKKYLMSSLKQRRELLAGILDTDGYILKNVCEITQKSKKFALDIKLLADSLGFRTSINKKIGKIEKIKFSSTYWRVLIVGDFNKIPFKRLKAKKWTAKSGWQNTGFKIKNLKKGKYAGFELSGDGRFLLKDGTVTHNTSLARDIAFNVGLQNKKILYYMLEDHFVNSKKVQHYFSINRLRYEEGKKKFPLEAFLTGAIDKTLLKSYFKKLKKHKTVHKGLTWRRGRVEATPDKILDDIREATKTQDLIIIDHLHYLSYSESNRQLEIESFMRRLSTIVKETSARIILLAHYRKLEGKKPTDESFKDAQAIPQNATTTIHLWRNREAMEVEADETSDGTIIRAENRTEFYIQKTRIPFASGNIIVDFDAERGQYEGATDWYQGGIPTEDNSFKI